MSFGGKQVQFIVVILLVLVAMLTVNFNTKPANMDEATLNEFQKSIKIDSIYVKHETAPTIQLIPEKIKVLNWNIERGYELEPLIKYMRSESPDIICLQEVDWNCKRTGNVDVGQAIAEALDMRGYFSTEYIEIDNEYRSKDLAGGGVHGNMILSKFPIEKIYRVELPQYFDWYDPPKGTPKKIIGEKRIGGRFTLCADIKIGDQLTTVCSVHFENRDSGATGRKASLDHLLAAFDQKHPLLLAGDLNTFDARLTRVFGISDSDKALEECSSANECKCWQSVILPERGLAPAFNWDDWTFKYAFYKAKLDWVITRQLNVVDKGIGDFNTSDHKPLWITTSANEK